ncbi:hypothetical protein Acr_05g0012900 [Actinidia rufa]|uniref:Uncharacterized protein n=1 Tax=Actinidia rufa TaxID=165716 RepID=A0A7J0EME1_9ERIC|nr:hypothetical protein Acr_05g0012900 [Actinidia rufa]
MDVNFIGMSLIVGVCTWQLAWTEIGFRRMPMAPVALYLGFMALSLAWDPIVFGLGAIKIGLLVSLARAVRLLASAIRSGERNGCMQINACFGS